MATVVLTDGDQRAALAAVRSLGRAGHRVVVTATRRWSLAGASRFVSVREVVPSPLSAPAEHAQCIASVAREVGADVVLPVTEAALLALLPRRRDLGRAAIPFPSFAVVRRVCDKAQVLKVARDLGIPTPAQRVIADPRDIGDVSGLPYPVAVKPTRSVVENRVHSKAPGTQYADDVHELAALLRSLPAGAFPVLVQQKIVGAGTGVFLFMKKGLVRAEFAHRRIREKPPSGGVSVVSESIPLDPTLKARSVALLTALEWEGIAMVEYKANAESGEVYLMEINGRLWGSLQLAIDAGVDFPALLVADAVGVEKPPVEDYAIGARLRWFWGDVDHLLARLRSTDRAGAVRTFLNEFGPGARSEVLRRDDPAPAVLETFNWLRAR